MSDIMIDWGRLKSELQDKKREWTPLDSGLAIDFGQLRREMGFKEEMERPTNPYKFSTEVTYDGDGKPWYEVVFNDVPEWIADKALYTSPVTFLFAAGRDIIDKAAEHPQVQRNVANYMRNLRKETGRGDASPYVGKEGWETAEDIVLGLEGGYAQFVELLTGKRPKTFADAVDAVEFEGMKRLNKEGKITDEDYKSFVEGFVKAQENPITREVVSGLVNSALILGSLFATGGLTGLTTRGLKIGSKAWLSTWAKNLHSGGVATWKLFATGATISATSDSIAEMKRMKEEGEDPTAWDFLADTGINLARKHSQAYLEGMSEAVLGNLRLGSVPLAKWLGKGLKTVTKEGKEVFETFGIGQLRRLRNGYPKGSPNWIRWNKELVATRLARKEIAKEIPKNFGKYLVNAFGIEVGTEQITDLWSDLVDGTHSSFPNLLSDIPEHRKEAAKTLYVEAAVSFLLGSAMGMSEIFSRKPLEEIEKKFGPEFAREVERNLNGEADAELAAKIKKAQKNPHLHNVDPNKEENNAKVILDQGKGTSKPDPEDGDSKAMPGVELKRGETFAKTINTVESLNNPNILDYVVEQGRSELSQYFMTRAKEDKDFRFKLDSFLMDADQATVNAITGAMYRDITKVIAERGLIDRINWVKQNESHIQKDLAIGVALNFDETGWAFLKHKYQAHDNIDYYIEEARKLQASNVTLKANAKVAKKYGEQTVLTAQNAARHQYGKSLSENIGLSISQVGSIIDAEIALKEQEELFDETTGAPKGGIAGAEVVKDDTGDIDVSDLGSFIEDDDILTQDALSIEALEGKARELANITSLEYVGYNVYPHSNNTEVVFTFQSPASKVKIKATQDELSYSYLIKKSISARGKKPMHAVAFRDKVTGKIYTNGPGHTHPSLFYELYDLGMLEEGFEERLETNDIEDGFIDKEGNYYSRNQAEDETGFSGESTTQGTNENLDNVLFETSIPSSSVSMPKYSSILEGFKGHTVRELVEFLVDRGHINEKTREVVAKLVSIVGDVELMITPMDPKNPGVTLFDGKNILMNINPEATLWGPESVWDTLAHEMIHAFTRDFMKSDTVAAKTFNGKIKGVMNTVYAVLNSEQDSELFQTRWDGTWEELQAYKKKHGSLIVKAMKNEFEFVSSVVTDTQAIKWVTDKVIMGGPKTRATGWRRIFKALQSALEAVGIRRSATTEVVNILERQHKDIEGFLGRRDLRFNPKTAKENRRVAKQITSGFENAIFNENDDNDDLLDPLQKDDELDDENELENASIENFTRFMALAWGIQEAAFREHVKELADFEAFIKEVNDINEANKDVIDHKLTHLFKNYQRNFRNFSSFKRAFLKRQYLNVVTKKAYDTFIYMGIRENDDYTGDTSYRYELRQVKGSYRDGKGKKRNTYRQEAAIEGYIPELEKLLGLTPGTLKLGYLDGFESWQGNRVVKRTSLDRVDRYMFGPKKKDEPADVPITGFIANALWNASGVSASNKGMIYLGNLAGKNTMPVLFFDASLKPQIEAALQKLGKTYYAEAIQEFGQDFHEGRGYNRLTRAQEASSITRAVLEDIWFKTQFSQQEDGTWALDQGQSQVIRKDWNKTMKRAAKWAALNTGIVLSEDEIEAEFGNAPINGIKFVPNDAIINAAVISSHGEGTVTFKAGNREITRTLTQLMMNELGTSRIDGASFYIIGHFDKVYRLAHGSLKSGALKNLYASRVGEDPLFVKHAMHGIKADSPLAQFMLKHNIAVLIADESMKEGPQDKIIGAAELMDKEAFTEKNPILELKLSQFTRIKEEENKDTRGGSVKQMIGGSGYSELFNDIIAEAMKDVPGEYRVSQILKNFSDRMSQDTIEWFQQNTSQEAIYELLKDIVYNPKSPQEQSVSELWLDYIEPLEGQNFRDVLRKYGGAFNHAHTAEVLRNRMQHKLSEMLGGKTTGMRGAMDPNLGWFNYEKDIAPVEAQWNLADLLVSVDDLPSGVAQAAFPEAGLYEIAQELLELQRRDTRAHNQFKDEDKKRELDNNDMTRQELIGKILELKSERLSKVVKEGTKSVSVNSLINWQDPKVKEWQDAVVWGKKRWDDTLKKEIRAKNGILDEETGALREGWAIITEDIADSLGLKAGDWVMLVVTPTDSAMGVIGVRIAGIAKSTESKKGGRKVSDNNKITVNSEWAQSLVGKDFDIDTISLVSYDERFWNKGEFEYLCKVANKVPRKYLSKIVEETKALFQEKGVTPKNADGVPIEINEYTVLQDEVRGLYSRLLMGAPNKVQHRRFPIVGASFIELDSAYLHDPAPIINERLFHTAISTINLRSKGVTVPFITNDKRMVVVFKIDGKEQPIKLDFNPRNMSWIRTHINHLHMTNAEVDFPNNTIRLTYSSDPKSKPYRIQMGSDIWGLRDQKMFLNMLGLDIKTMQKQQKLNNLDNLFKAMKGFQKFLFDDAFNLARQRNSDTFEKLDYITTIQQTRRAQRKLAALATKDVAALKALVKDYLEGEKRKVRRMLYEDTKYYNDAMLVIKQQSEFLNSFVENLEVDNVYDYPLFETIRNIDVDNFPVPGNTYKDHLINQVLASKEAIGYYPVLQEAYDDAINHAMSSDSDLYKVRDDVSYKPAYRILKLLGQPTSDAVNVVRGLRKNKEHFEKLIKPLKPWELDDLKDAIREFDELDRRAGKAYEPFERDGQLVHVDMEAIAMERIMRSLDYSETVTYRGDKNQIVTETRGKLSRKNPRVYWSKQLRGLRYEVNSILHAFDEKYIHSGEKGLSEQAQQIRHGHAATYPTIWKALLENPFLFLNPGTEKIKLRFGKEEIFVGHKGDGTLHFLFRGEKFTHQQIQDEISDNATELKKLLTERDGLWEGIADGTAGAYNRVEIAKLITLARNLTMERRMEILEDYIADNLYASSRGYTRDDQIAFWIGIMAQVSDQGMLENKGTGFIVNQSPYDKLKPFKFQSNHVALTLMSRFESELTNMWLQFYSMVEGSRNPYERDMIAWAVRHGMDSDVEMLYQDAPEPSFDNTVKHFFSDYLKEHKTLTKDLEFTKFYNKMRNASWKDGLTELRKMAEGIVMLKALSENGVFYEDLVHDVKTLSDAQFFEKYKGVNTDNVRHALERYMGEGVVDEFIRQRAGESEVEFQTRGNVITTFYMLNGAKKREGARNKKLNFMRRIGANVIGYDMVAILGEKQTRVLDPKDEVVGDVWDVEGVKTITTRDAQLAMRTHATRTDLPIGESVIAITKGQRINRTLNTHQITLNNQAKRFEDVAKLLSGHTHRNKWRVQFVHKKENKRIPHTARTKYISTLLDQIPESADQQLEIRREQIWNLAEDLKKRWKIQVLERADGTIVYSIRLGTKDHTYTTIEALIEGHLPKLKASQKLALIGALDIRTMYDIMVPKYLAQAVSYLEHTRDMLNTGSNIDQALQVDAIIQKYKLMLAASKAFRGNYMPHQFPIGRYKAMWTKGYIDTAIKRIQKDIIYHKKNKTGHPLGRLDPVKDMAKIKEMALRHANKVWDQVSTGWNRGSIIPNFIPRRMPDAKGYTKTDPTTHYNYITKLMEGLKKDALRADWYLYQANARMAGERHNIIELTRAWYADQIGDRSLRTVNRKWSEIKPGMQVTFTRDAYILTPGDDLGFMGSAQVSGTVRKITADEIVLNTDPEAILFEAKRDLDRWDRAATMMMMHGGESKPSERQWNILQNFINKGVLTQEDFKDTPLNKMDELGATTMIIKAIKKVIANPQIVNTFKRTDVWGNDVTGAAKPNTLNLYVGHGAVERLGAKADYWKNVQLMGGVYDGSLPRYAYWFWKGSEKAASGMITTMKKLTGLFYMGMAAAGKARVVNQMGAIINNLIDAPIYNFDRWKEGSELYSRIKHGQIELMDESDAHLYKTLVGLGLTEDNNILAIALEAANIKPEDMLINDATTDAIKWLAKLFRDATKYDSTYKALAAKEKQYMLEPDATKQLQIKEEIEEIKLKWQAKMHNLLKKGEEDGPLTNEREKELWKQLDEAAKSGKKINLAEEQGFTQAMALKLFAKVAWKSFYTSNFGMGFQAKAERMRIPAFFIGYTTAIHMGFLPDEAIQLGVNSVELRHAFYGSANKQFGANTKLGTVSFQYAQYQYNAISKAVRIMREAVPQMLRFAHNRPETTSRLKHMANMLKLIQVSTDAKGKALKRGQVTLKEINLLHVIMMKVLWTAVMMQVGRRIFYGVTNFQDPVGQAVYNLIDFVIDLFQEGFDPDDEDDKENLAWAIQDITLPLGMLYKMSIQATLTAPEKGYAETFVRGRVEDTFDFVWRASNTIDDIAYQLGYSDTEPDENMKTYVDMPWLVDDFVTGIKLVGWTSADNEPGTYMQYGFFGERERKRFTQGRYVETEGRGISGFGQGDSNIRAYYLADPLTYIPFLDRLVTGK